MARADVVIAVADVGSLDKSSFGWAIRDESGCNRWRSNRRVHAAGYPNKLGSKASATSCDGTQGNVELGVFSLVGPPLFDLV